MFERLKVVLEKILPDVDMSEVSEDTKLVDELNFDSLALMMMSMEIEDAMGFKFTEFVKFETVGDVCRYLEEKGV
jgi:acyl carrier protein